MHSIRGFKTKKKLRHWESICEEWLLINERYSRLTEEGDEAFTCKERANIGLLAGAAWKCGRIALEEFHSIKLQDGEEKNGRVDLWLCNDTDNEEFIEAKFSWASLNSKDIVHSCEGTLALACKDAIATKCGDNDIAAVGVAFIAFYIKGKNDHIVVDKINDAIESIKQGVKYDAVSWCFPEQAISYCHDGGNITPGIFMIAKKVK